MTDADDSTLAFTGLQPDDIFETLDELRERIRTDLSTAREKAAEASLHKSVIDSLIARETQGPRCGAVDKHVGSHPVSLAAVPVSDQQIIAE